MRRKLQLLVGLIAAAALVGCGGGKPVPGGTTGSNAGHPPTYGVGATEFVSQAPGGSRAAGGAANDAAGGASPGAAGSSTGGTGTSASGSGSSTPRAITEADIYKVAGNTLFVLNQYRGLQIVDVSDLAHPKLQGKVPVIGTPVDLYVEGTTAYVIVSDAFQYQWSNGTTAQPWIGSQVWAIDVSQPAAPHVLSVLPVDGEVAESRIVGNVLYVVSNVYSWYDWGYGVADGAGGATPAGSGSTVSNQNLTYVQSFDISNPLALASVQRLDFPAGGWEIHANVTQSRIVLSESGWDSTSGALMTQFAPIDISDPAGKLVLGTTFSAPGRVQDRWAMDFDPTNGIFRAVLNNDWGNTGGTLVDWSAPTVQAATQVGSLALNLQEAVTAASFDGPRAYIVTSYCTDPLWIVDTTDPAHPQLRGSVQMSGALDFVLPRGNQLLALGHESDGCMAWEGSGQLAVSLFDVTNPDAPTLASRVVFGAQYSYIDVKADDMKKAFQVLDNLNLLLVPFQSWDQTNWTYAGGTQLIDYDSAGEKLTLRGFAEHAGDIKRAFPVQDKIVALSDRSLQVLDITDRDHPTETASLDLARPVISLAVVGNQAVELSGDWSLGDTYLVTTDAATPDQATPNAQLKLPSPYARMYQDGSITWILSNDYTNNTLTLQAVDVSNPSAPVKRGQLTLDPAQVGYGYGGWWYWGYGAEVQLVGHALVLHNAYWGCYGDCGYPGATSSQPADQLWVVDLRNPDAPALDAPITLTGSDWSWGLTESGGYAWITHYEWVNTPGGNNGWVRYYVDRLDVSDPANPKLLAKINVPGVFFAADANGTTLYTQDVSYDANWSNPTTWLNKLTLLPNGQAQLAATLSLSGYPDGAVVENGRAYLENWDWSGQSRGTLNTVDLATMTVSDSQDIGSQWSWLRKAAGGKLFAETYWYDDGVLVYDLSNPSKPSLQGTVRTNGWIYDIVVSGNTAYLPSGYYGVPTLDLTPGAPLPNQVF